jgi:hypothetical protein
MGCCRVCGLEFPQHKLVIEEIASPKLSGDGEQVRVRLQFCARCWRDPDRADGRHAAYDAALRELLAAGADALSKTHSDILSNPPEAALPWQPMESPC